MSPQDTETTTTNKLWLSGYTLVELLTVIAVISIVLGVPFLSMLENRHDATIETGEAIVVQALKSARSKAMSGVAGDGHGVCLTAQTATVFELGSGCSCGTCTGVTYELPPSVTVDTERVEFQRLSGATGADYAIDVSAHSDTRSISIEENGFIE